MTNSGDGATEEENGSVGDDGVDDGNGDDNKSSEDDDPEDTKMGENEDSAAGDEDEVDDPNEMRDFRPAKPRTEEELLTTIQQIEDENADDDFASVENTGAGK